MTYKEFKNDYVAECMQQFGKTMRANGVTLNEGWVYNSRENNGKGVATITGDILNRTAKKMWQHAKIEGGFEFGGDYYKI